MMGGGIIAAGAAAAAAFSLQLVIPPPTPSPVPLADDVLTLGDAQARMTVPVSIRQRGPWNFIIDTGAERTVVSRELAGVLGLPSGPVVRVTAMTGSSNVGTVIVPGLSVSTIAQEVIQAPALEARNMGAPGMLGVDALQGHSVGIDFDKNQMTLKPSRKRTSALRTHGDDIVITAKSVFGQLIVTDAHWRGVKISVVIDTGSPVTIGNPALFAAMKKKPTAIGPISVLSATGGTLVADAYSVDDIAIGGILFNNVPIAFADAPPFRRFNLRDTPAVMLGMDALRLFRAVNIDFANREIRFTLPRGSMIADPAIHGI